MGMVVRTNTMAINANRQLGMNNNKVSNSLEKLSSGFKINRAGDDASGLAISEKMKAQIKSLDTASANCQDGISLVQTAEGALTEVHDMLNRIVELAEKSANGTMETADAAAHSLAGTDRNAIQEEVDALCQEIDRIAQSTNFNGIKLLDGSLSGVEKDDTGAANIAQMTNKSGKVAAAAAGTALKLQIGDTSEDFNQLDMNINGMNVANLAAIAIGKNKSTADWAGTAMAAGDRKSEGGKDQLAECVVTQDAKGNKLGYVTLDVSDQTNAGTVLQGVKGMINVVSTQRAQLGAVQNRLEHTVNNLDVASENMNAANSRIRDTDMAKTMMEYTKMNVLTQSAQAMLAQANQQPQSVLQLLQ